MSTTYSLLIIIIFIWSGYLTYLIYRIKREKTKINSLNSGSADVNLLGRQLAKVSDIANLAITKVKLVRYNPFEEIGGDQSFILILLDNHHSGVIITSLHNRGFTRIYAKTIKNGESESATLSKEEKNAILKVINS